MTLKKEKDIDELIYDLEKIVKERNIDVNKVFQKFFNTYSKIHEDDNVEQDEYWKKLTNEFKNYLMREYDLYKRRKSA